MNWRNHQKAVYCLFTNIEYPQQKFKGNCSKALLATRRSPSSGHFKSYQIKQREDNDAIDRSWMCVRGGGAVMNLVTLSNLKCCNKCYSNHLEELYVILSVWKLLHLSIFHKHTHSHKCWSQKWLLYPSDYSSECVLTFCVLAESVLAVIVFWAVLMFQL